VSNQNLSVHIELKGDVKLDRCPRCGAKTFGSPEVGLHEIGTTYECATVVVTQIYGKRTFIDVIGSQCSVNVQDKIRYN